MTAISVSILVILFAIYLPDFIKTLEEIRDELKRFNDREERKGL